MPRSERLLAPVGHSKADVPDSATDRRLVLTGECLESTPSSHSLAAKRTAGFHQSGHRTGLLVPRPIFAGATKSATMKPVRRSSGS
jgi:hypothetical protein